MRISVRLAAVVAMCAAVVFVMSCAKAPAGKWQDGSWQGKGEGLHGEIDVTVAVAGGRITKVTIDKQEEAAGVSDVALQRIPEEIVKAQSTKVDAVAGASMSSKGIIAAVEDALAKAVKQ